MTTTRESPSPEAMEHARLVLNAIAQFEAVLRPRFESCVPDERRNLSRMMSQWLAETPNAILRAALLDHPCPAEFFTRWISAEEIKHWLAASPARGCPHSGAQVCIRPSEVAKALRLSP